MKNLKINQNEVDFALQALATANEVSVSQMASFIYRKFYAPTEHRRITEKIHYHLVAADNLTKLI